MVMQRAALSAAKVAGLLLQSNTAQLLSFYHSAIIFPYKLHTFTKWSCWNRRDFKTVSESSVETQVSAEAGGTADNQTMKYFK